MHRPTPGMRSCRDGESEPTFDSRTTNDESQCLSTSHQGVVLIPTPSDNQADPLNWSSWRKSIQLITFAFCGFSTLVAINCNTLAFVVQSSTYKTTAVAVSYGSSAGIAGLIAGPLFTIPLSRVLGRSSVMFWSVIACIACQIWAAAMTRPDQYISYIMSRMMIGLVGSAVPILGTQFVMDVFFLHQRGKVFSIYELAFIFGTLAPATISGLIVQHHSWTICFWWTLAPLGLAAIMIFAFLEESNYDRATNTCVRPAANLSWWRSRMITIFAGWEIVPRLTIREHVGAAIRPLAILVSPVSIAPGFFSFLTFGFAIMVTLLIGIYLQTPIVAGGYAFTPERNAYYSFVAWVGSAAAWATALLVSDRLPLALASRWGRGVWQPEYRLVNMIIPIIFAPIGLGLIGAGLRYHLHYMVIALGNFLVVYAAQLVVPFGVNYVIECYVNNTLEVAIAFNIWRCALGLALPFAADAWEEQVGIGWVFGMAAFFVLFGGLLLLAVIVFGTALRSSSLMRGPWTVVTEGGQNIITEDQVLNCAMTSSSRSEKGNDKV